MRDQELESLWQERLASHETSGKSIAAWCQEHSLKENQFYYWRKKLRLARAEKGQARKWISLETDPGRKTSPTADYLTVHIGQVKVEIKKGFDQRLLRDLVYVLKTL